MRPGRLSRRAFWADDRELEEEEEEEDDVEVESNEDDEEPLEELFEDLEPDPELELVPVSRCLCSLASLYRML